MLLQTFEGFETCAFSLSSIDLKLIQKEVFNCSMNHKKNQAQEACAYSASRFSGYLRH